MIADAYMRRHLTRNGFKRLAGAKPDDLFVYTDGDELIHPEILVRNILRDLYDHHQKQEKWERMLLFSVYLTFFHTFLLYKE